VSVKDLEELTEQAARNQHSWKTRVEQFSSKVFGAEPGREGVRKSSVSMGGKKGGVRKQRSSIVENSRTRMKQEAIAKHRMREGGGGGEGDGGRISANDLPAYEEKLRQAKFFGPYVCARAPTCGAPC
jgi:hypothetical protein